jgi:hypothetical protein
MPGSETPDISCLSHSYLSGGAIRHAEGDSQRSIRGGVEHELVNLLPQSRSKEELNQIWKGSARRYVDERDFKGFSESSVCAGQHVRGSVDTAEVITTGQAVIPTEEMRVATTSSRLLQADVRKAERSSADRLSISRDEEDLL